MCRTPFDQPQYKVRVSIQRLADNHVSSNTYVTSNIDGLVSTFGIDAFADPRYLTDILFEIGLNETLDEVFQELGLSMPGAPYVPLQVPPDRRHT
jgi:hypothetical protein